MAKVLTLVLLFLAFVVCSARETCAQTTEFTFQGSLKDNAAAANGNYDFEFALFDALAEANQIGSTIPKNNVLATNGIFSVKLDFGSEFPGANRFLEIRVRLTGQPGFTTLAPRQLLNSAPYSVKSLNTENAETATNATQLGGVAANQFVVTTDPRMTNDRAPTAGSTNYIQNNPLSQQSASSFNISGDGTVGGILSARLNAIETDSFSFAIRARNLSTAASQNIAVQAEAVSGPGGFGTGGLFSGGAVGVRGFGFGGNGTASTTGVSGLATGSAGTRSGVSGFSNASTGVLQGYGVFGSATGPAVENYGVFGAASGGTTNWAGYFEGNTHITGNLGIAMIAPTERLHVSGNGLFTGNAVAGDTLSGNVVNTSTHFAIGGTRVFTVTGPSPSQNVFVGVDAGNVNTSGTLNSFFGTQAGLSTGGGQQNSFFGGLAGKNNASGNSNSYFGLAAGSAFISGNDNSFFGAGTGTGANPISGTGNSFFGSAAGFNRTSGDNNSLFGTAANASTGVTNGTAIGYRAFVALDNSLVLGSIAGINGAAASTNVGIGLTNPTRKLHIIDAGNSGLRVQTNAIGGTVASFGGNGVFEIDEPGFAGGRFKVAENGDVSIGRPFFGGNLTVNGNTLLNTVTVANAATLNVLGAAGSQTLCRNASLHISSCSSSLRYKQNINPFGSGLDLINRLRPVTFNWKANNKEDLGLIAEEVAEVEPLLATYKNGQIEGVKYDRIGVIAVNAIKEQQSQLESQKTQIETLINLVEQQQLQIKALKNLVCLNRNEAAICREKE